MVDSDFHSIKSFWKLRASSILWGLLLLCSAPLIGRLRYVYTMYLINESYAYSVIDIATYLRNTIAFLIPVPSDAYHSVKQEKSTSIQKLMSEG